MVLLIFPAAGIFVGVVLTKWKGLPYHSPKLVHTGLAYVAFIPQFSVHFEQTQDFIPGGLTLDEGVHIAKILSDIGFDAIEPSGGGAETQIGVKDAFPSKAIKSPEEENYFLPTAKKIKPFMKNCALMLMGGIKNPISAEKILQNELADFISMCRPLIYEPDLPNRWKNGDLSPAKCISCNSCYMTMLTGPVYCVVRRKAERKKQKKA